MGTTVFEIAGVRRPPPPPPPPLVKRVGTKRLGKGRVKDIMYIKTEHEFLYSSGIFYSDIMFEFFEIQKKLALKFDSSSWISLKLKRRYHKNRLISNHILRNHRLIFLS